MLFFNCAHIHYEPYPICLIRDVFDPGVYKGLVEAYPPLDLFAQLPEVGNKWVFSEKHNGKRYRRFIARTPIWSDFHRWIKGPDFVDAVDAFLKQNMIDLGLRAYRSSEALRWRKLLRDIFSRGRLPRVHPGLYTRFEFSMLQSDGGYILPHTDAPGKLVTLVLSMVGDNEWLPEYGGGTDVNRSKDIRRSFNLLNRNFGFEDVDVLRTFEFRPNQCILFVKTFNSLHSVRPMSKPGARTMRRTITINIVSDA